MSIQTHLTDEERKEINEIYARAVKKYLTATVDYATNLQPTPPITMEDAIEIARMELDGIMMSREEKMNEQADHRISKQQERKARLQDRLNTKIARINTDAHKRGVANSTVVATQLARAISEHERQDAQMDRAIENIETMKILNIQRMRLDNGRRASAMAKRIHNDALRNNLQLIREMGAQQSRSFRDMVTMHNVRMQAPINEQRLIDDEVRGAYMLWLFTNKSPAEARSLVLNEPTFMFNLSLSAYMQLREDIERRWHT